MFEVLLRVYVLIGEAEQYAWLRCESNLRPLESHPINAQPTDLRCQVGSSDQHIWQNRTIRYPAGYRIIFSRI